MFIAAIEVDRMRVLELQRELFEEHNMSVGW